MTQVALAALYQKKNIPHSTLLVWKNIYFPLPVIATNCWGEELTMLFELGVGGFVCVPLSEGVPGVRGVDGCVDPDEPCKKLCTYLLVEIKHKYNIIFFVRIL